MTTDTLRSRWRNKAQQVKNSRRNLLSIFPCKSCGENDSTVIQWHHIESNSKKYSVGGPVCCGEDKWWNEVLKCVPLCANCHIKIHRNTLCLLPTKHR